MSRIAESRVGQAAARLHSSIALLAQQQASDLAVRRQAAARALPPLDAAVSANGAAAGAAAAADRRQTPEPRQGELPTAAAGDAAAAGGLHELRPWPLVAEEADEAGDAAAGDEAVDVAGDWERGPRLAGIPTVLQIGDAGGGEKAVDAAASDVHAELEASDPPQLRAATQHGFNFAVTLLGEALP